MSFQSSVIINFSQMNFRIGKRSPTCSRIWSKRWTAMWKPMSSILFTRPRWVELARCTLKLKRATDSCAPVSCLLFIALRNSHFFFSDATFALFDAIKNSKLRNYDKYNLSTIVNWLNFDPIVLENETEAISSIENGAKISATIGNGVFPIQMASEYGN